MKSFNVINGDFNSNKMEAYDIMPFFVNKYKDTSKNKRPTDFESAKKFIKSWSATQFWMRCEYEIILSDWPNQSHREKWDVDKQINMNLDIVTEIFMENVGLK
jgi:hypothetical protein